MGAARPRGAGRISPAPVSDDGRRPVPSVDEGATICCAPRRGRCTPAERCGTARIGGEGVASGYLGDPEQTAERFVSVAPGAPQGSAARRLYRTGDLARWDHRGGVQLIGRLDNQVKIRGHRIEIAEIESRMADWPGLAESVVVVRPDTDGHQMLCAYGVPFAGSTVDWPAMHRHLCASLPTFMIPSHFVELPALPLTPNGKVDIASLPAPQFDAGGQPHEAPGTLYEVRMADH